MIRLRPQRRLHISNRLALVGALMLALTAYTGFDNTDSRLSEMALETAATSEQTRQETTEAPARKRGFSISQLLFGHG